jgi:hypothetical protein
MIYTAIGLIIASLTCLAGGIFWKRGRAVLLIASFFALLNSYFAAPLNWLSLLNGYGFWLAPISPSDSPAPLYKLALPTDSPETIIRKMGCPVCHRIPDIPESYESFYGPLLIPGTTASQIIASEEYREQVRRGLAKATTPREYVIESILDPNAFIVPGFSDKEDPQLYLMYPFYAQRFTPKALEKLADHLLTLNVQSATEAGLIFSH